MRSLGWNKGLGQDSCCKEDLYFNERLFQFKKPTIPSAGLVPVNFDIGSDCTVAWLCNFTGGSGVYEVSYTPGIVNGYPSEAAALASARWITTMNLADNNLTPNSVAWYAVRDKNNPTNVIAKSVTIICDNIPLTCFRTTTSTSTSTSTTTKAPDPPFYPISDVPLAKRKRFIARLKLNNSKGPIVSNSKVITVTNLFSGTQLAQSFTEPTLSSLITTSDNQATLVKTIAFINDLPDIGIVDIPCNDDRVFIYVEASTTGTVYGGGTYSGFKTAYSEDSDIATAAVHAGILTPGQTAYVKRQYVYYYRDPTKLAFFGSTENGITTLTRIEGCGFYFDPTGTIFVTFPTTTSTTTTPPGTLPGLCRGTYVPGVFDPLAAFVRSTFDVGPILTSVPNNITDVYDYPQENYDIMWTGFFKPPADDEYTFSCDFVDDGFVMWIGYHGLLGNPFTLSNANLIVYINSVNSFTITLPASIPVPIRLLYVQATGPRNINFQISGKNLAKTNNLDYLIYRDICVPSPVSVSVTPSAAVVGENMDPLSFSITTTGLPVGTSLYWYFDSVEAIDWTLNSALGTLQIDTSRTDAHANNFITATAFSSLVNLTYLKHLGRYPNNVTVVNSHVNDLVANTIQLEDFDTSIYNTAEAAGYRSNPPTRRRYGNLTTTGSTFSTTLSGTVIYDSKYEGPQTGNLLIRYGALNGVILANTRVTINDTIPSHNTFDPVPPIVYPGQIINSNFITLGSNYYAGKTIEITAINSIGSGNVAITGLPTPIKFTSNVFVMPLNANTNIQSFTFLLDGSYTFNPATQYFRLAAYQGANLLAVTDDIKCEDFPIVTYPCPAVVTYQGGIQFPAQHRVDLGTNTSGDVTLTYTAYFVPDRFMVIHDGAIVADSGYVGDPGMVGDVNSAFSSWPSSHTIAGVTINHTPISSVGPNNLSTGLTFTKNPAVRYATVLIFAPIQGTAWECTLTCPVPDETTTSTTTSTTTAGPKANITLSSTSINEGGWPTIINTAPLPPYLSNLTIEFDTAVSVGTAFCANITGVSIRDINQVSTIGTFQNTTITDALIDPGNSSMTVNVVAQLINVIYLHYLGRYPENSGVVDGQVTAYQGHKSLLTLDDFIKNSAENTSYDTTTLYRQILGTVPANRKYETTLIAVPDMRYESAESGTIELSLTDCLSPVEATKTFDINEALSIYVTIPWPYVAAHFLNCANASNILTFACVGNPPIFHGKPVSITTYAPTEYYENGLFPLPPGAVIINDRVTISSAQNAPSTNSYELQFTVTINLVGLAAGTLYFIGLQGRIDGQLVAQTAGLRIETDGSCT